MLPSYVSSAQQEKMMRQGYGSANGNAGGFSLPTTDRGFSIKPHKYDKYQPRNTYATLQQRRQMLLRVGGVLTAVLFVLMFLFPVLRPASIVPGLSLGLFSSDEAFELETVRYYDLSNVGGTSRGWEREERILLCAPLRDASHHLPMFFSHLRNLTYPHNLIDLAFLVGDSKDQTLTILSDLLAELQGQADPKATFGEISVIEKDFGQTVDQDVESRHGFAAQASRRKSMAQARNWLLSAALRPTHSWVYWRDVDVETAPFTILEDLMRHNKDIIVPNVWRPLPDWLGGEQPYDLNSWQESETALALAETLDEDAVIVEGYAEYATWRPHLAYLRDPYGDPDMEMEIDGVGGVSILAKARVFRAGVHFPAFSFEKHAETEGFGKMAKRMQFSVVGLPHYTIWHMYEPSVDDIQRMEEMEAEKKEREVEEKLRKERVDKIQKEFDDGTGQWEKDKEVLREMSKKDQNKDKTTDVLEVNAAKAKDADQTKDSSLKKDNDFTKNDDTKKDDNSKMGSDPLQDANVLKKGSPEDVKAAKEVMEEVKAAKQKISDDAKPSNKDSTEDAIPEEKLKKESNNDLKVQKDKDLPDVKVLEDLKKDVLSDNDKLSDASKKDVKAAGALKAEKDV